MQSYDKYFNEAKNQEYFIILSGNLYFREHESHESLRGVTLLIAYKLHESMRGDNANVETSYYGVS